MFDLIRLVGDLDFIFGEDKKGNASVREVSDFLGNLEIEENDLKAYIPADYEDNNPKFNIYLPLVEERINFSRDGIVVKGKNIVKWFAIGEGEKLFSRFINELRD